MAAGDLNGDGSISTNELPRFGWGYERSPLGRLDQNGDGIISSDELIAAAEALANDLQERLLAKYDANQDGVTSVREWFLQVSRAVRLESHGTQNPRFTLQQAEKPVFAAAK